MSASDPEWLETTPTELRLRVHAVPGSSRSEVAGVHGGRLKIRLKARPIDGAANKELIQFLANELGVARRSISISSGQAGRRKTLILERYPTTLESVRTLVC